MATFDAFWVEQNDDGLRHQIVTRDTDDLPEGDVLVEVFYSSLNYKDGMSAKGIAGVTRAYPHTPGIDAAGIIRASSDPTLPVGEEVIVIGFDLGMNTPGGFGQYIRVPSGWVVPMPAGLSLRESMILGTAIDAVGGPILSNVIKSLNPQGSVAICGLVASSGFDVSVLPFILRGVNVLGIDSVELPLEDKARNWTKLAQEWRLSGLESMSTEVRLDGLSDKIENIMEGSVVGRTLVRLR